jgi:hypothetical protein
MSNESKDFMSTSDDTFDLFNSELPNREAECCISVWVPKEYKEKYDLIQKQSRWRFSKFLRQIVKRSIDKVPLEAS